jgi:hypothetical protein
VRCSAIGGKKAFPIPIPNKMQRIGIAVDFAEVVVEGTLLNIEYKVVSSHVIVGIVSILPTGNTHRFLNGMG